MLTKCKFAFDEVLVKEGFVSFLAKKDNEIDKRPLVQIDMLAGSLIDLPWGTAYVEKSPEGVNIFIFK